MSTVRRYTTNLGVGSMAKANKILKSSILYTRILYEIPVDRLLEVTLFRIPLQVAITMSLTLIPRLHYSDSYIKYRYLGIVGIVGIVVLLFHKRFTLDET